MISVRDHDELKAVVLALKAADRDLRSDINRATRETLNPVWRGLVETHATYKRDHAILAKGARIKAGNPPVAVAASSRRKLRGGLIPANQWHAVEFGANRDETRTYQRRSPKGTVHKVTRHTRRQLPPRYRKGTTVYPAFAEFAPRAVSLWVQLIIRKYNEAAENASRKV